MESPKIEDENGADLGELSDTDLERLLADLVADVRGEIGINYPAPLRADALLKIEKIRSERQRRQIQAVEYLSREQVEREQNIKVHTLRAAGDLFGQVAADLIHQDRVARMDGIEPFLVDEREAARLCGVAARTWQRYRAGGLIGPREVRLGGVIRWNVAELRAWINAPRPGGRLLKRRDWPIWRTADEAAKRRCCNDRD